jgi:hypothetical protein
MLRTIWNSLRGSAITSPTARWAKDPLAHPDLSRMSLAELADLPFEAFEAEVPPPLARCAGTP